MKLEQSKSKPRLRDYYQPKYWLSWFFIGLLKFFSFLPLRVCWLLGVVTGEIAYRLHQSPTIKTNVRMCYPNLSKKKRARFVRQYYREVSYSFYCLGLAWFGSEKRVRKLVKFIGHEHCTQALKEGRNIILLSPHTVSMEVCAHRLSIDQPYMYLYSKPKNKLLHHAIFYYRTRQHATGLSKFVSLRPLIRNMKKGLPFYYLPDQNPDNDNTDFIFVPFMGVSTATYTAPARMVQVAKAVVLPCYSRQLPFGAGFEFVFKPRVENYPTGDIEADTRTLNFEMEKIIEIMPEQYLWSHRRFKTRPNNASSPYVRS